MIYWILAIFVAMLPDKNTAKRKAVITAIDEGVTVGLFPADATAGSVDLTLPAMQVHLFWARTSGRTVILSLQPQNGPTGSTAVCSGRRGRWTLLDV
jgi:hypothetical protein